MFRYDDIGDRFKNKLNIVRVCCAGYMRVDCLLAGILVETDESLSQVVDTILVCVSACEGERERGRGGKEGGWRERGRGKVTEGQERGKEEVEEREIRVRVGGGGGGGEGIGKEVRGRGRKGGGREGGK